jgi:ferredoxin
MRVRVDQNKCIGSGQCVKTAPAVFEQDDDNGIVVLRHDSLPAGLQEHVRRAARVCPAQAITVADG